MIGEVMNDGIHQHLLPLTVDPVHSADMTRKVALIQRDQARAIHPDRCSAKSTIPATRSLRSPSEGPKLRFSSAPPTSVLLRRANVFDTRHPNAAPSAAGPDRSERAAIREEQPRRSLAPRPDPKTAPRAALLSGRAAGSRRIRGLSAPRWPASGSGAEAWAADLWFWRRQAP
jgi:hypothetical protein